MIMKKITALSLALALSACQYLMAVHPALGTEDAQAR